MPGNELTIFVSAAEASGDHHGAALIRALRRRFGQVRIVGAAGPKMAAEGCEVLADLTQRASMLGSAVLRAGHYYGQVRRLQRAIREIRPDVHIPIDSPALNWHLAAAARKSGAKVVYYIAPQVWAWAPWRIGKVRRLTDAVACILPFEQEYFRSRGVNAHYVGHPLFDEIPSRPQAMPDLSEAWAQGTWRVALVPGSREAEIRGNCQALLGAARRIRRRWPQARCTFAIGDQRCARLVLESCNAAGAGGDLPGAGAPAMIEEGVDAVIGPAPEVFARSHFGIIKSGTVTLEAAWMGMPMIIFYRTSRLLGVLRRVLRRTPVMGTRHLSLVNILAGQALVPELMPWHGSHKQLESTVLATMNDLGYLHEMRQALIDLVEPLKSRPVPAADRVAELVEQTLHAQ